MATGEDGLPNADEAGIIDYDDLNLEEEVGKGIGFIFILPHLNQKTISQPASLLNLLYRIIWQRVQSRIFRILGSGEKDIRTKQQNGQRGGDIPKERGRHVEVSLFFHRSISLNLLITLHLQEHAGWW